MDTPRSFDISAGIRPWQPAQRARLVADQIESKGLSFSEAGQKFGLSAQAVGRLYRAYKALEQMRQDDDFQGKALNEYFSLFEEAIRNRQTRDWLGWRDELTQFENTSNLKQFLFVDCSRRRARQRPSNPRFRSRSRNWARLLEMNPMASCWTELMITR